MGESLWDTEKQEAHLPERRVLKGAHLLAEDCFDVGRRDVTLRQLQTLRGIATGWASIVHGLKNELKAVDVFLGGTEPNGPVWRRWWLKAQLRKRRGEKRRGKTYGRF